MSVYGTTFWVILSWGSQCCGPPSYVIPSTAPDRYLTTSTRASSGHRRGPRGVFRDLRPGAILRATARPRQFKKTTCDLCCFNFLMKKSDLVTWGLEKQWPGDLRGGPLLGLIDLTAAIWRSGGSRGGGGSRGSGPPPPLGHDVGFLTLGPKLDPLLDPPPPYLLVDLRWTPLSKILDPPLWRM